MPEQASDNLQVCVHPGDRVGAVLDFVPELAQPTENQSEPGPVPTCRTPTKCRFWLFILIVTTLFIGYSQTDHALLLVDNTIDRLDQKLVAQGFGITRVTVSGASRIPDMEIREALGDIKTRSVLRFDVNAAQQRLQQKGWILEAKVTRRLPNALHVAVIERKPFAIWQSTGRVFLIDRLGNIIATNPGADFSDLPLVNGLAANVAAAEILDALNAHPDISAQTRAIIRVAARRWNLQLENGVTVKLPAKQPAMALSQLASLEKNYRIMHREIEVIDLRDLTRVTLKLTPDAATRRNFLLSKGASRNSGGRSL